MISDIAPFKVAGNLYFVGEYRASSHLIDTGDGLILIDVGYAGSGEMVAESISLLGYDVRDVKMILLSHGHRDHSGGAPEIVAMSGAKVYMFREDMRYLTGFTPDVFFNDGDVINLGNTSILCLHTPGHTAGTASFFFDVCEDGETLRVGTFGGAGVNQLKRPFLDARGLPYTLRRDYLRSIERLRGEHVDVFLGNHTWQSKTREKLEKLAAGEANPFINPAEWLKFLNSCERTMLRVMREEGPALFIAYAHRGASEYYPENTELSFDKGLEMRANGIETDVRRTRDGRLVLFHDSTLTRVVGIDGSIEDMTYAEVSELLVKNGEHADRVMLLEDFLKKYASADVKFAIELKGRDVEADTAELLKQYCNPEKCTVTSFELDYLEKFRTYAPEFRLGYLTPRYDADIREKLYAIGVDELCPSAKIVTPENVEMWHAEGFRVRAYGINRENMISVYEAGVDGMTVNFPDLFYEYIDSLPKTEEQ